MLDEVCLEPILLGYFAKELWPPAEWLARLGVDEVASVSLCLAGGPDGWADPWKHNEWGFFANPQIAWSLVPKDQERGFRLYAYAVYPVGFLDGEETPLEVAAPDVLPLGPEYERVGFDAVSRSAGMRFECSPLSCNMLAEEVLTNSYCLFPDLDNAREFARTADEGGCEPGPYHVVEVWRKRA